MHDCVASLGGLCAKNPGDLGEIVQMVCDLRLRLAYSVTDDILEYFEEALKDEGFSMLRDKLRAEVPKEKMAAAQSMAKELRETNATLDKSKIKACELKGGNAWGLADCLEDIAYQQNNIDDQILAWLLKGDIQDYDCLSIAKMLIDEKLWPESSESEWREKYTEAIRWLDRISDFDSDLKAQRVRKIVEEELSKFASRAI
jgi:hypothetical protein